MILIKVLSFILRRIIKRVLHDVFVFFIVLKTKFYYAQYFDCFQVYDIKRKRYIGHIRSTEYILQHFHA